LHSTFLLLLYGVVVRPTAAAPQITHTCGDRTSAAGLGAGNALRSVQG